MRSIRVRSNASSASKGNTNFHHRSYCNRPLRNVYWPKSTVKRVTQLETVAELLESTRSRTSLNELKLLNVDQQRDDNLATMDRFATSFATLKLEKFIFSSSNHTLYIRLDTLDPSRLTERRVAMASIEPEQLTNLIERASSLRRIEFSFLACHDRCNDGPRLLANKKLITALALCECLTAIKFDTRTSGYSDCYCTNYEPEFIEMLKAIGRRGQLKKLPMERRFFHYMDATCATIRDYIPYLQSIKLNIDGISDRVVTDIVSLPELEEIHLSNTLYRRVLETIVNKAAHLPRLKRLAVSRINYEDKNSIKCLANATALIDLRIQLSYRVSADILEQWSKGFASNLKTLMLRGFAEKDEQDEEGLIRFLGKAVKLRVLILQGRITDRPLITVAQSCPDLEIFGVRSTLKPIDAQHLQQVVDRCPKLRRLGGFDDGVRRELKFPKYRKMRDVDMDFWKYDFDNDEYD